MLRQLFLCLVIAALYAHQPKIEDIRNGLFFISPSRSGTHLTNLAIQFYTRRPYYRICEDTFHSMKHITHCNIPPNYKKKPYYHTHIVKNLVALDQSNQLLMIIRNPKELAIRYTKTQLARANQNYTDAAKDVFIERLLNLESYELILNVVRFFHTWPEDKRLVITYEEMIENPCATAEKIVAFLGEDVKAVAQLLPVYQKCKLQMLENYNKRHHSCGGSISKGKNPLYHTQPIPKEILQQADALLKKHEPELWRHYFSQYETL